MSMKSLAVAMPEYAASVLTAPSYLRIAVPSWRSIGIHSQPEPVAEAAILSREEIQSLFHGELNGKARKKTRFTDAEERQKQTARRIRMALYPYQASSFSH